MQDPRHKLLTHPASRLATLDVGRLGALKHHVAGFVEVDVSEALRGIQQLRERGEAASFFAWVVRVVSATVGDFPEVHALRAGKTKTVQFDDVDVSLMVEREVAGVRVPLPLLIHRANAKPLAVIHSELRAAKSQTIHDESDYVLAKGGPSAFAMRTYYALPQLLRLAVMRRMISNPFRRKAKMGTVMITSLGSVARVPGWVLPKSIHGLCFALGSIIDKPWVVDERVVIRKILHLTVLFDHDVVDGAPATRFIAELVSRMERGADLPGIGTSASERIGAAVGLRRTPP